MPIFLRVLAVLAATVLASTPAYAQRYLTEFVGVSQVASTVVAGGVAAIDADLSFDTLDGRALDGAFSFLERDARGDVETALFSADATLAASGQCPARVEGDGAEGHVQLDEFTFDANAFALLGRLDLTDDPGAIDLTGGRVRGPVGFLNPPVDALAVIAGGGRLVLGDGRSFEVGLGAQEATGAVRGGAFDGRGAEVYRLVLASGPRWLYVLGVSANGFLVGRGEVTTDGEGFVTGGAGALTVVDSSGKERGAVSFELGLE